MVSGAGLLDFPALAGLSFEAADMRRYPGLQLAWDTLRAPEGSTAVLNAANEVAVAAFLERKISFMEIARLVEACCLAAARETNGRAPVTVAEALEIDHMSRERARSLLN
jgi:1-deoxy-D-xylulose-5-phosphate reductoisomerase